MSGRSGTVREEPDEFTEVALGHEGRDFVAYAGAGNAEELFRFGLDDSSVEGVALGDILEHVTGVWLVNQGAPGLTALHDWVEITGTGSSAPVPDGAEVAESLDAATRSVSAIGPAADRAALVAFYEATGGPNWTSNDGWLTNAPLNDWHGVSARGGGWVAGLYLSRNNLTGEIPPQLGDLANLQILFLDDNELTGEIPPELGGLPRLRLLHLEQNRLTGPVPPEFGDLTRLEHLSLDNNELTGEIPPELGDLARLEHLSLDNNELTGPIPPELGRLARLGHLSLDNNELTGEIPPELGGLANLRLLPLNNNDLTGEIPPELSGLANLRRLSLRNNDLTGEIPPRTRRSRQPADTAARFQRFDGPNPGTTRATRQCHVAEPPLHPPVG